MCLTVKKLGSRKNIIVYKELRKLNNMIPILLSPYHAYIYEAGDTYPQYYVTQPRKGDLVFGGGLHAFVKKPKWTKLFCNSKDSVLLKIKVPSEDVVAFGVNNDVVVKRLHITEKQYKKAIVWKKSNKKSRIIEA